jgi:hypothetical protein
MPVRDFEQDRGMAYGVGFDSVSGIVCGDCVVRTDPESPAGVLGQKVSFKLRQITSSSELAKELEISASASLRATFGGASAKATFASSQKINQFSIYLLVQVRVTNPTRRLRDVKLTNEASELLKGQGLEAFRKRCGDEFLSGITTGGEYLAILQANTSSDEEQKKLSISMNAKGAGGMWSASASFRSSLEQISQEHSLEVTSFQQGGDESEVPDKVEEIIKRAVNFPKQVEGDKAYACSAFFQDYKTLDLPQGMNPIDVEQQKNVIEKLAEYYLSYSDVLSSIEYVTKNFDQFDADAFVLAVLSQKANDIRKIMNMLRDSASNCFNDYRSCNLPENIVLPVVDLPARKRVEVKDAINAAKAAANNATGYAADAKKAAQKVMDILRKIAPGSSGKDLADEARKEVDNAKEAAKLAKREADNAVLAKDMTEEATQFADTAIVQSNEAEQAVEIANRNAEEAYKIGYKPYWNLSTKLIPYGDERHDSGLNLLDSDGCYLDYHTNDAVAAKKDKYYIDPSGGKVKFAFVKTFSYVVSPGFESAGSFVTIGVSNDFVPPELTANSELVGKKFQGPYVTFGYKNNENILGLVAGFNDPSGEAWISIDIKLVSDKSGLENIVTFQYLFGMKCDWSTSYFDRLKEFQYPEFLIARYWS